ncbi:gypsy type transposase, partial [Tanacetum coccineum]
MRWSLAIGFGVADNIKTVVERACRGVVSCVDILPITATDLTQINVKLERHDSRMGRKSAADSDIRPPTTTLVALISSFNRVGLSAKNIFVISGGMIQGLLLGVVPMVVVKMNMVVGERTDAWFIKGQTHIVPGKLEQRGSVAPLLSRDKKTRCGGPSYVKAHGADTMGGHFSPGYRVGGDLLSPSSIYQFMSVKIELHIRKCHPDCCCCNRRMRVALPLYCLRNSPQFTKCSKHLFAPAATRSGQSGALVGQGSVVIVTTDVDYLTRMLVGPLMAYESVNFAHYILSTFNPGPSFSVDLLLQFHLADHHLVRNRERRLERERFSLLDDLKRKIAEDASGLIFPQSKLREINHDTFGHVGASSSGKSLVAIQELFEESTLNVEVDVRAVATIPFDSTPDTPHDSSANAADDEVTSIVRSSVPPPPLMTAAIATTIVDGATFAPVLAVGTEPVPRSNFKDSASPSAADADAAGPSQPPGAEPSADTFYISQDMDPETLQQICVPKWDVINDSSHDDLEVCKSMVDQLTPPDFFSQLRGIDYIQLFAEFNLGVACQVCFSAEDVEATEAIRLRHQVAIVEATEATRVAELNVLKRQVADVEFTAAAKDAELSFLTANTTQLTHDLSSLQTSLGELTIKAASLESEKDG